MSHRQALRHPPGKLSPGKRRWSLPLSCSPARSSPTDVGSRSCRMDRQQRRSLPDRPQRIPRKKCPYLGLGGKREGPSSRQLDTRFFLPSLPRGDQTEHQQARRRQGPQRQLPRDIRLRPRTPTRPRPAQGKDRKAPASRRRGNCSIAPTLRLQTQAPAVGVLTPAPRDASVAPPGDAVRQERRQPQRP